MRRVALACLLLGFAGGAAAAVETLADIVEKTLINNPDVLIDVSRRLAADEGVTQAVAGFLPRVDLALGRGKQQADNATTRAAYAEPITQRRYDRSMTLTQMLFDGFGAPSELDRTRARVESAAHKVAYTSEQTALKAVEAYLEVLRQEAIIDLTKENVASHLRTYDQIKLRASSGVGRKSDQDQIEARLALAKSNLTAAEANLVVARVNFKLVVGAMPGELIRPAEPALAFMPRSPEDAVTVAMGENRILMSAQADLNAAEAQHSAAKAALYPRVDLEMGVQHNDLGSQVDSLPDSNKYAMLKLRYNIFRGGADSGRVGETLQQVQEAHAILERAKRQLEQSIRLSWNAYKSALNRLPDLRKHSESSLLTRDAYTKQFALGQRTLLDLLDTENEYYTAGTNYVNGQFVELFSRYRVLADVGLLLGTLGVAQRDEAILSGR